MPIISPKKLYGRCFLALFVALDKTRHLGPVAAPFRKNKVMHRMLNVDTFLILAARARRARACMQVMTYFVLYCRPHTQGTRSRSTSWLLVSLFGYCVCPGLHSQLIFYEDAALVWWICRNITSLKIANPPARCSATS